jgi:TRAP-type C4-dicarboxylate transport system permease small subunit
MGAGYMSQGESRGFASNIERITEIVLKKIHYFGMVFALLMMLLTTVHAVGRYLLGLPLPGLVELSSYMLVTMIFLTAPYTALRKGHIAIGVLVDRLSERTQAIIDIFIYLPCLAVSVLAAWQTFLRASFIMQERQVSTILSIPNAPFIFVVGLGWSMFSVAILIHIINAISRAIEK